MSGPHAGRTYVVTGSASGIGAATARCLEDRGARVIGADLHDAPIEADLGSAAGRSALVEAAEALSGGVLDGVVAAAGVLVADATTIRVNYFGVVATLEGLRPLLARSAAPAAVAVASVAVLQPCPPDLVELCLGGDEEAAAAAAQRAAAGGADRALLYAASKRALARWVRAQAPSDAWAGAGIALNAIGPAMVATPMMQDALDDPVRRARLLEYVPMPFGGPGAPEHPAALLAWLAGPENRMTTGQLIFVDGGYDAVTRGDDIWPQEDPAKPLDDYIVNR